MVGLRNKNNAKPLGKQEGNESSRSPIKIGADTPYDVCNTRMTAFGGYLAFIKFLEMIDFEQIFTSHYCSPSRKPKLGCYKMILGCLSLLFIGFQRIGHFDYIRKDPLICGVFGVTILPAISTFWRYLRSLCINQSRALLKIGTEIRCRVWQICDLTLPQIHVDIDTTVLTVYGEIQGACKGHNTKRRGKEALRPILGFIEETKEYIYGKQRRGETVDGAEFADFIGNIQQNVPTTVKRVIIRADGEFLSWASVKACMNAGYHFILANKSCKPLFDDKGWYKHGDYEYNETIYQPNDWEKPCRFVVMRITKEKRGDRQLEMFEDSEYMHRVFATDYQSRPHHVIEHYDGRANVELCIKEAQNNGLMAIPSKSFLANHVFFQIVMLSYNIWRWMQMVSQASMNENVSERSLKKPEVIQSVEKVDHRIQFMRLKMLFLAAKVVTHSEKPKIRYSIHDVRSTDLIDFMKFVDRKRSEHLVWHDEVHVKHFKKAS